MLIIAGTVTVDPAERDRVLDAVAPMVAASRAEDGCHEYVFTPDPHDPAQVRLFELWESQGALDAHFASAHMAEWQALAADLPITGRDILKYQVSDVGPVR